MATSDFPSADLTQLLNDINDSAVDVADTLPSRWIKFRNTISDPPERVSQSLVGLSKDNWHRAIDGFLSEWVYAEPPKNKVTREAAIRLLGHVGYSPDFASYIFEKLWQLANSDQDADLRSWALYSLHHCNLTIDEKRWPTILQIFQDKQRSHLDEIRYWATYAIGSMARECEQVRRWDDRRKGSNACHCRVERAVLPTLEAFLADRWGRETDVDVNARIVEALGWGAGWGKLPQDKASKWRIVAILQEAADSNYLRTPSPVHWAIKQITANTLHSQNSAGGHSHNQLIAIEQLLDLAIFLIENCPSLKERGGAYWYNDDYAQQREYLLAIKEIARMAIQDEAELPLAERVVSMCVERLLHIANLTSARSPRVSDRLRWLALIYMNDLVKDESSVKAATEWLRKCALPIYKRMLSDEDPEITRTVVTNMVTLMGEREAADYFVSVILDSESKDVKAAISQYRSNHGLESIVDQYDFLSQKVRRAAAQALGTIPDNNVAHDRLVENLRSETMVGSWARDALLAMGGQKAIDSMVQYSLQKMVQDKFFAPMEQAREQGWQLLNDIRFWSNSNYQVAYKAAIASFVVGMVMLVIGVLYMLTPETAERNITWILASGVISTVAGIVGTFLWEPVKGLNKVESELVRMIMSFENYLGRMRLIGLGFAHAYTTANWNQLEFLEGVSLLSGKAMYGSASVLAKLGEWPDVKRNFDKPYTLVPALVGKSVDEARRLVEAVDLHLDVGIPAYDRTRVEHTVVSQIPEAETYAGKGATVKIVPSTTHQPTVKVPDFKGKTIMEALDLARDTKLTIKELGFQFHDGPEGKVMGQDLKPDLMIAEGTPVGLTVSKKDAPKAEKDSDTNGPAEEKKSG